MNTSAPSAERKPKRRKRHHNNASHTTKLARLPENAKVHKRPLLRTAFASPRANFDSPKVVYIGTKSPFLSAVKRIEKLLYLSDKRLVQSSARIAQNQSRMRRRRGGENDSIGAIAEVVEEQKQQKTNIAGEEIVIKGTGKAIAKVLEVGLWFQQRAEQYVVRLKTSSTSSIDDIEFEAPAAEEASDLNGDEPQVPVSKNKLMGSDKGSNGTAGELVEETRIRKVSVLEAYVRLK